MVNFSGVFYYYSLLLGFLLMCLMGCIELVKSECSVIMEVDILSSGTLHLYIPILVDVYSMVFSVVVLMISSSVMYYNGFYMDGEVYYNRFSKLVLLFVLSMLFLVFIPNLLGLMVGWDGLGLTSYLLVIYYQDKRSLGSGTLTVLSNRIGDVLFFMGVSLGSGVAMWGFKDLSEGVVLASMCGVVVVGCMTKSAQLPFSAWLPAAMAAPSPVSALVHSSTLVTAGVYVLVRFSGSILSEWYLFLGVISSMTMLMAAMSAVYEPDVKKVVALSTLSQLGVMMLAISVGAISVCFFHLVSHALFKALMFLCVGAVIHYSGIQDIRYIGGLIFKSPIISAWLMVACLSLSGFPFLAGFYSKDLVLEAFMAGGMNYLLCIMVMISTCLTAFYSMWMVVSVMRFSTSMSMMGTMVSNSYVYVPCFILGVGALFGGLAMQSIVLDFNLVFNLQGVLKLAPISCVGTGIGVGVVYIIWYTKSLKLFNEGSNFTEDMMSKMWFAPLISSDLFSPDSLKWSGRMKADVEDGFMEHYVGSEGLWVVNHSMSSQYLGSQLENMGVCMVKGLLVVMLVYMISMAG